MRQREASQRASVDVSSAAGEPRAERLDLRLCEYAVLGSLMQQPRTGYDIAQWFAQVTSHFWVVGHSSIYPALANMKRLKLVEFEEQPSQQGPTRKVYHLTPAGRDALLAWVETPAADAEVRDEQLVKAFGYGFIPPARAIELLRQARARYVERQAHFDQLVREAADDMRTGNAHEAAAALGRKLMARRSAMSQQNAIAWCDEAIAELEATM